MEHGIYGWNAEEVHMVSCYWENGKAKEKIMEEIREVLPHMEMDIQELARRTMKKLYILPDEEYRKLVFK